MKRLKNVRRLMLWLLMPFGVYETRCPAPEVKPRSKYH